MTSHTTSWTDSPTRPTGGVQYLAIADHIEREIRSGRLKPNERLPNTEALSRDFNVTVPTIQKSLSRLTSLGLLNRAPRRGTFVSPSIGANTIALALGSNPYAQESQFPRLIIDSFHRLCGKFNLSVTVHILSDADGPQNALRLEDELKGGKTKCVYSFFHSTFQSKWMAEGRSFPWLSTTYKDCRQIVKAGVAHLLAHGRRDIRILSRFAPGMDAGEEIQGALEAFSEAGVTPPKELLLQWGQRERYGYEMTRSLMNSGKRPDALLVNHDMLTRGVLLALMERGVRVPEDIALISHENKGAEILAPFPLTVLRFDPDILAQGVLKRICDGPALSPGCNSVEIDCEIPLIPRGSCGESIEEMQKTGDGI